VTRPARRRFSFHRIRVWHNGSKSSEEGTEKERLSNARTDTGRRNSQGYIEEPVDSWQVDRRRRFRRSLLWYAK